MFKKLKVLNLLLKCIDDILLIFGMVLISVGVFKIYMPTGFIMLGVCFTVYAFLIAKKVAKKGGG